MISTLKSQGSIADSANCSLVEFLHPPQWTCNTYFNSDIINPNPVSIIWLNRDLNWRWTQSREHRERKEGIWLCWQPHLIHNSHWKTIPSTLPLDKSTGGGNTAWTEAVGCAQYLSLSQNHAKQIFLFRSCCPFPPCSSCRVTDCTHSISDSQSRTKSRTAVLLPEISLPPWQSPEEKHDSCPSFTLVDAVICAP